MIRRRPLPFALALSVCVAACDSGALAPTLDAPGSSVVDARQPLDVVADGVLKALARPLVRAQMIALMRSSPWVEHKVSLTDAMAASGGTLRREAAAALDVDGKDLDALLAALPPMDFYLANGEQRRSWKGDGQVRLAVSGDDKAFTTLGGEGTGDALFALHPAEPKSYRIGRQAQTAGSVIEDAGDGDGGLTIEYVNARGQAVSLDVGASGMTLDQVSEFLKNDGAPITLPEPGPARITGTLTDVEYVSNNYITDGVGSAEIEWKAYKYIGGVSYNQYKLRWTGVEPWDVLLSGSGACGGYSGCLPYNLAMWYWVPSLTDYVKAEFWETDTGSDDHYGTLYWADTEGGTTKTTWGGPDACWAGGSQMPCAQGNINYY